MDRERLAWLRLSAVVADAALLGVVWTAVVAVRASLGGAAWPRVEADRVVALGWLVVPVWLAALGAAGSWRALRVKPAGRIVRDVVVATLLALLGATLLLFLARIDVNRSLLLGFAVAGVPVLCVAHFAQRAAARVVRRVDPHRVFIVGGPERAALEALLAQRPDVRVVHTMEADEVIVAGVLPAEELVEVARACDELGVPLSLDANFLGLRAARVELQDLDGWTAITFRAASDAEPGRLAKRALDLVAAASGLLVALPVIGVLALAIRVHDGASPWFVQERIGRYGRPFRLLKLRTMIPSAPAVGVGPKPHDDPRVTGLGRLLRRTSLDELPQLVNVLRGEMSLVGPRPPLPEEVARYERWQLRRLSVRPGMTGLWQVSGRADLTFERCVALDLEYVDSWSLWLDVRLLARTVPAVLRGEGAR